MTDQRRDELADLTDGYMEATLTLQQVQRLQALVKSDASARRQFIAHTSDAFDLVQVCQRIGGQSPSETPGVLGELADTDEQQPSGASTPAPALDQFVLHMELHARIAWDVRGREDISDAVSENIKSRAVAGAALPDGNIAAALRFFTRPTPLSMTAAAVFISLVIATMAFVAAPIYRQLGQGSGALSEPEGVVFVARLTGARDAQWGKGQIGTRLGAHLPIGHRMALVSGLIEITYRNGAVVLLEGPSTLLVTETGKCRLERGKLTAKVPASASGFNVETPHGKVVDLGTEFGVEVLEDWMYVAVFQGQVVATSHNGPELRLVDGDRARVTRNKITPSALESDDRAFRRSIPGRPTPLALRGCDVENNSQPPWILQEGWNGFTRSQGAFRPRAGKEMLWASAHEQLRHVHAEIQFDANEHTISAGEYRLAVSVGMETARRIQTPQFLTPKLTDASGIELPARRDESVSPLQANRWTTYLIRYTVPPDSNLIGKPLRLEAVGDVLPHHSVCLDGVAIYLEETSDP